MNLRRSVCLISLSLVALYVPSEKWVSASEEQEDADAADAGDVDVADFDYEEEFSGASKTDENEQQQQKQLYEEEEVEGAVEEQLLLDGDDLEPAPTNEPEGNTGAPEKGEEVEELLGEEDLNEKEENMKFTGEQKTDEEAAESESDSTSSSGATVYNGQEVQLVDEEGTALDVSSLAKQDEYVGPSVTEFVDKAPTFKKEKEEKKKRKAEAKSQREKNNPVDIYEQELEVFKSTQEKNKDRFKDYVENAEADLQAPEDPGFWKRIKRFYDRGMTKLVEKYGSQDVD